MMEINGLTVHFDGVIPLDDVTIQFPMGVCGLIGPNGAGKTTLFNVLSGFVEPAAGSVRAFGFDLLRMANYRRARWGLRRTFQTGKAIEALSVFDNVALVYEHSSVRRAGRRRAVLEAIDFVGIDVDPGMKAGTLSTRNRRLLEIACALVGEPRVILLDEPAAGFPDDETAQLGQIIRRIPHQRGALVILVDHDMSLVSACCQMTAVLDFGRLIACGETASILRNEQVIRAYLGTEGLR
jgi:branched-chain amino acid transport system ATP-binding protein